MRKRVSIFLINRGSLTLSLPLPVGLPIENCKISPLAVQLPMKTSSNIINCSATACADSAIEMFLETTINFRCRAKNRLFIASVDQNHFSSH